MGAASGADAGSGLAPGRGDVYGVWCTLLDIPEESFPLAHAVRLLAQGGEVFGSFVQFMSRTAEPHRRGGSAEDADAVRRSCVAMQVMCHALAGPNVGTGLEAPRVLGFVCYELLAGLQPRSPASSLHICTALQHLLCAHEAEVCRILLQCRAPFALLRALDRPGCGELLMALLTACEPRLLPLVPSRALRPLSPAMQEEVLAYIRSTRFAELLAALLDQGARLGAPEGSRSGSGCSARCVGESPAHSGRAGESPPVAVTPSRHGRHSPGASSGRPSPGIGGVRWPSTPGSAGAWTPQRPPSQGARTVEASPLCSLALPPSSPSPLEEALSFLELPVEPRSRARPATPELARHSGRLGEVAQAALRLTPESVRSAPRTPSRPAISRRSGERERERSGWGRWSPAGAEGPMPRSAKCSPDPSGCGGSRASSSSSVAGENGQGVSVLLEFLAALLDYCSGVSERRPKRSASAGSPSDEEELAERRTDARRRLVEALVLDTTLVAQLFRLLRRGASQFESASLLYGLVAPGARLWPSEKLAEALLAQYLARADSLGSLLLRGRSSSSASGGGSRTHPERRQRRKQRALRLNAYTVREPLGALRVAIVQIFAALIELAPERTLQAIRPAVWGALVHWFLVHRCNHIFQAVCSKLFIAVVNHGGSRLQHHVLVKHKLVAGICDTVLAEGSCGDCWHDLRAQRRQSGDGVEALERTEKSSVAVQKRRHPGGLGAMLPVVSALAQKAAAAQDNVHTDVIVAKDLGDQIIAKDAPALARGRDPMGAENEAQVRAAPTPSRPPSRRPLAERQAEPQACRPLALACPGEPVKALPAAVQGCLPPAFATTCHVSRLLAATPMWPQVLGSLGLAPAPRSRPAAALPRGPSPSSGLARNI